MNFKTIISGEITHVELEDSRLDAAQAIRFKEEIRKIADDGADNILLDMGQVQFMDSSGLGALVSVLKYMGTEKRFEIVNLTQMVEKVFKLTRMDEVFCVHNSVQDAFDSMEENAQALT